MKEARLRSLLRETPIPAGEDAEQRGLRVVSEAFAQRQPARRDVRAQIAIAVALGTLLAALMLSPAGAAVRDWVGGVFSAGVPGAEPSLTDIPGGGRLLVQSDAGHWVVEADGSRRLLGRYESATWSPRGLFVGAVSGRTLTAVEPDGDPRWSLSADGVVRDPRWSPSGFQIAYRAGAELRLTAADGSGGSMLDRRVEPVAPAWASQGLPLLAYVGDGDRLRVVNADTAEGAGSAPAQPGITLLEWASGAPILLEASPTSLRLRELRVQKLAGGLEIGAAHELPLPAGATVDDAALSPDGRAVAALLRRDVRGAMRSEVVVIGRDGGPPRRLLSAPGRLAELAWSPDMSRLLISWPDADQWLFVPSDGHGRVRAVGGIAAQFAPGDHRSTFPRIEGWCCTPRP